MKRLQYLNIFQTRLNQIYKEIFHKKVEQVKFYTNFNTQTHISNSFNSHPDFQ